MDETLAPEKPAAPPSEVQSASQTRFDNIVTILMALVTVWGAFVAVLENTASNREETAAIEAQAVAVESLGKFIRADQRSAFGLDVVSAWDAAGNRAAQAQAGVDAARLRGESNRINALEQTAARWLRVQQELAGLTPLLTAEYGKDSVAYQETLRRDAYLAYEHQQAALEATEAFGNKADSYTAVITALAVVLFLLGLSLTMTNWLRNIFVGVGMSLAAASVIWVAIVALRPVRVTPESAMQYYVDGLVASNQAQFSTDPVRAADEEVLALQAFDAAIAEYDRYANAYLGRGYTLLGERLRDADRERNARAAADIQRAIDLGVVNSVSYTNLSWAHILSGDYEEAVTAAQAAMSINPQECVAIYNLGWAQLALNQSLKAAEAYAAALDCTLVQSPNNQDWLFNAGIVDLHDMALVLPKQDNFDTVLENLKEASASIDLIGKPVPQQTNAVVDNIRFASEVTADDQPVELRNRFPGGTSVVYTFFDFERVDTGSAWMVRWYRDGDRYDWFVDADWQYGATGATWVSLFGSPLPEGEYVAEVYIGGNLLGSGRFFVEAGSGGQLEKFESEFFGVAMNYPSDWSPVEEATDDGYLYFAPEGDDTRYWLYFSLPWDGDSQSLLETGMDVWREDFPDIGYRPATDWVLAGIPSGRAVLAGYTEPGGVTVQAMLMSAVDAAGQGHFVVVQAPENDFDNTFDEFFRPMLDSLEILR